MSSSVVKLNELTCSGPGRCWRASTSRLRACALAAALHKTASAILVVLCGLPGAGKSALARALVAAPPPRTLCAHVSVDAELEAAAAAPWSPAAWHAARAAACAQVLLALDARAASPEPAPPPPHLRRVVLVDDNHPLRSMRKAYARIARAAGAALLLLHLDAPLALAQARNATREPRARVDAAVIARMSARFEAPGGAAAEPAASVPLLRSSYVQVEAAHTLCLPAELPPAELLRRVLARLEEEATWRELPPPLLAAGAASAAAADASRAQTASSAAHHLDLALRRCVASAIEASGDEDAARRQARASLANAARRAALTTLRPHLDALLTALARDDADNGAAEDGDDALLADAAAGSGGDEGSRASDAAPLHATISRLAQAAFDKQLAAFAATV